MSLREHGEQQESPRGQVHERLQCKDKWCWHRVESTRLCPGSFHSAGCMERGSRCSLMLCKWIGLGIFKETSIDFKLFFSLSTFKLLCEHDHGVRLGL